MGGVYVDLDLLIIEYSLAKIGFDKAENEPSKVLYKGLPFYLFLAWIHFLQPSAHIQIHQCVCV